MIYAQLCGVGAALFSGYYPLIKPNVKNTPIQSIAMILNAAVAYTLASKVAELIHPLFEQLIRTTIRSQHGQVALFAGTVGALFVLPKIIEKIRGFLQLPQATK